jgi:hypothetical protein
MKSILAAATVIMVSLSATSAAQTQKPGATGAKPTSAKETKFCLTVESMGSRRAQVECKTKGEWARDGVDIDEELKK